MLVTWVAIYRQPKKEHRYYIADVVFVFQNLGQTS